MWVGWGGARGRQCTRGRGRVRMCRQGRAVGRLWGTRYGRCTGRGRVAALTSLFPGLYTLPRSRNLPPVMPLRAREQAGGRRLASPDITYPAEHCIPAQLPFPCTGRRAAPLHLLGRGGSNTASVWSARKKLTTNLRSRSMAIRRAAPPCAAGWSTASYRSTILSCGQADKQAV